MHAGSLTVVQLYPVEADVSNDHGNVRFLHRRADLYGLDLQITEHRIGDDAAQTWRRADIVLGGSGQRADHPAIRSDLAANRQTICGLAADGLPMLVVDGLYQLFGNAVRTPVRQVPGIGVLDAHTVVDETRLVGNVCVRTAFGDAVGYENHHGTTILDPDQAALGTVLAGAGNNGHDGTEGARRHNVFGTYLQGPVLPRNPFLADELIRLAVERQVGHRTLTPRDGAAQAELDALDGLARQTRQAVTGRPAHPGRQPRAHAFPGR